MFVVAPYKLDLLTQQQRLILVKALRSRCAVSQDLHEFFGTLFAAYQSKPPSHSFGDLILQQIGIQTSPDLECEMSQSIVQQM
jgi:hypothetical protein